MRALARLLLCLLPLACGHEEEASRAPERYDRLLLDQRLEAGQAGLVIGEYPLSDKAIVDGDTIKVDGLDASMRLIGLDCEETFKNEKDLRAYEEGFEKYLAGKREKTHRPVKVATPMGMEAKHFAQEYFRGVTTVRLERDHPKELRDTFERYLTYVFVEKAGVWKNYNVECVRAGMSPYFTKYGQSRRFHEEFIRAQEEARAAERGIWDPSLEHYPDYEARLRWWDARGQGVVDFEREAAGHNDYIVLTHWDALTRLADLEGREVTVLGLIGKVTPRRGKAPARVSLSIKRVRSFPLVFFDDDVLEASGLTSPDAELVSVRGTVTSYTFKTKRGRRGRTELQIVVKNAAQVRVYPTSPPGPNERDGAAPTDAELEAPLGDTPPGAAPSPGNTPPGDTPPEPPPPPEPTAPPPEPPPPPEPAPPAVAPVPEPAPGAMP